MGIKEHLQFFRVKIKKESFDFLKDSGDVNDEILNQFSDEEHLEDLHRMADKADEKEKRVREAKNAINISNEEQSENKKSKIEQNFFL